MFKCSTALIAAVMLIVCSLLLYTTQPVQATSSECRGPSNANTGARRGAASTLSTELDEMIETELLNAHVALSEQGLNAEDLEYFTQLTEEHISNTLFLRRLVRRIGRVVRRIGRAIGRVFRAIGGIFRRRRAREIIMSSVANFNGYTGPNRDSLDMRREFIGGGVQKQATTSAATTLGLFRRRKRRNRRSAPIIPIINSSSGSSFIRSRSSSRGGFLTRLGQRIGSKIKRFASKVKGHLKSKMETLEKKNQAAAVPSGPVNCVACRVDCLKNYAAVSGGSMFTSCGQRYYYYGCRTAAPCFKTTTASDDEIEGMVGICVYRNGCQFKKEWKAVSDDQILADRLVGRIRGSGQADPE